MHHPDHSRVGTRWAIILDGDSREVKEPPEGAADVFNPAGLNTSDTSGYIYEETDRHQSQPSDRGHATSSPRTTPPLCDLLFADVEISLYPGLTRGFVRRGIVRFLVVCFLGLRGVLGLWILFIV